MFYEGLAVVVVVFLCYIGYKKIMAYDKAENARLEKEKRINDLQTLYRLQQMGLAQKTF